MFNQSKALVLSAALCLPLACGQATPATTKSVGTSINNGVPAMPVDFEFKAPEAGVDYPTDTPVRGVWRTSKVLLVNGRFRIRVPANATFDQARAGVDYPADQTRLPHVRPVLVLGTPTSRLLLDVWTQGAGLALTMAEQRIPLADIVAIVQAEAGIDFPTDTPPSTKPVVITRTGTRIVKN